jgi:hypothetical protein
MIYNHNLINFSFEKLDIFISVLVLIISVSFFSFLLRISVASLLNNSRLTDQERWHRRHIRNSSELRLRLLGQSAHNTQTANFFGNYMLNTYPIHCTIYNQIHLVPTIRYIVIQSNDPYIYLDVNNVVRYRLNNNPISPSRLLFLMPPNT